MRQALHIFRKDVRFLWLPMLVVLAMTAVFAWSHSADPSTFAKGTPVRRSAGYDFVFPGDVLVVLHRLPHLPGAARRRLSVLGDAAILLEEPAGGQGAGDGRVHQRSVSDFGYGDPMGEWVLAGTGGGQSAGRQIAITAIFLLPAAAIAAVTRHLAQIAFTGLTLLVLYAVANGAGEPDQSWDRLAWIPLWTTAAVLAGGMFWALAWQFARRRTPITRLVLAGVCGMCAAMPMAKPFGGAIALESHFRRPPRASRQSSFPSHQALTRRTTSIFRLCNCPRRSGEVRLDSDPHRWLTARGTREGGPARGKDSGSEGSTVGFGLGCSNVSYKDPGRIECFQGWGKTRIGCFNSTPGRARRARSSPKPWTERLGGDDRFPQRNHHADDSGPEPIPDRRTGRVFARLLSKQVTKRGDHIT